MLDSEKAKAVTDRTRLVVVNGPEGPAMKQFAAEKQALKMNVEVAYIDPEYLEKMGLTPVAPSLPLPASLNTSHTSDHLGAVHNNGAGAGGSTPLLSPAGVQKLEKGFRHAATIVTPRGAALSRIIVKAMIMRPYCAACGDLKVPVYPIIRFPPGVLGCSNYPHCQRMMSMKDMKIHAATFDCDHAP